MLSEMTKRRAAIRRMFTHVMSNSQNIYRDPSNLDWAIGERVSNVLDTPCKIVVKSQSKGHWYLPDAIVSMAKLYVNCTSRMAALREPTDPTQPQSSLERGLARMEVLMLDALTTHLDDFVKPLRAYDASRAHTVMGLLCDHRYRRGEPLYWLTNSDDPGHSRIEEYRALLEEYTDKHLIPAMVNLKLGKRRQHPAPAQPPPSTSAPTSATSTHDPFSVPDDLLEQDSRAGGSTEQASRERAEVEVIAELERFRHKDTTSAADLKMSPLQWWKKNAHLFPVLADVARIALACPSSQSNAKGYSHCVDRQYRCCGTG